MLNEVIADNLRQKAQLIDGLKAMPEARMLAVLQQIHYTYLPKVQAARGEQHPDTVFFTDIRDCLIWAMHIMGKYNDLATKYQNSKMLNRCIAQENRILTEELAKYNAATDMVVLGTLDDYRQALIDKGVNILNQMQHGHNQHNK